MTESMTTDTLIDQMEAAHQTFVRDRLSIIREFLAGLSESDQLELVEQMEAMEQETDEIESQVAEALAHSAHYTVRKALMDVTQELSPVTAPFLAWATIGTVEYDSDDDEYQAETELQQQALDAIESHSGDDYHIVAMDAAVNGP